MKYLNATWTPGPAIKIPYKDGDEVASPWQVTLRDDEFPCPEDILPIVLMLVMLPERQEAMNDCRSEGSALWKTEIIASVSVYGQSGVMHVSSVTEVAKTGLDTAHSPCNVVKLQ